MELCKQLFNVKKKKKNKTKPPHFNVLASFSQNQSCVSASEIDLRIKGCEIQFKTPKPLLLRWMFKIHQRAVPLRGKLCKLGERFFSFKSCLTIGLGAILLGIFEMSEIFWFRKAIRQRQNQCVVVIFHSVRSDQCTKYQLSSLVLH